MFIELLAVAQLKVLHGNFSEPPPNRDSIVQVQAARRKVKEHRGSGR